ncbi:MAG: group II intron maturase-specific domain-containing protein, partial [Bacillota bacterium]
MAPKTIERFKDSARVLKSRSKSRTMGKRMEALNMYFRRWVAYFRLADTPTVFERLGKRIRRRLRMSLRMLTQWKKPAMRGTGPVSSGIPEQRATD